MERRNFMKAAIVSAGGASLMGVLSEVGAAKVKAQLTHPLTSTKLLKHDVKIKGQWTETKASLELVGSNGTLEIVDVIRRMNGKSRVTTIISSLYENEAATMPIETHTKTIFAEVGEVGEDGKQEVELTVADESGIRPSRITRAKANSSSFGGLTDPQEIVNAAFAEKGLK